MINRGVLMKKLIRLLPTPFENDQNEIRLRFGEDTGLVVDVLCADKINNIDFGVVFAFRVFDEGLLQEFSEYSDEEIKQLKATGCLSGIYQVEDGNYIREIDSISRGILNNYSPKQYIIISSNYVIEIVSFAPCITVN